MENSVIPPTYSTPRNFGPDEVETWNEIMEVHRQRRTNQLHPMFMEGLRLLGMDCDGIPDIQLVNKKLRALTGWEGVFVKGFEDPRAFYPMLRDKKFPIGNFIRSKTDLSYTPEPDIVHDFYGHIPFLANQPYADYCQKLGEYSCEFIDQPKKFRQFERVFWFGIEFALVKTDKGIRIFGAGIASSIGECEYALSDKPTVLPFDIDVVRNTEFRIDQMQTKIFLLNSPEQLYGSLPHLMSQVRAGK